MPVTFRPQLARGVYGRTTGRTKPMPAARKAKRRAANKIAKASRRVNRGGR